MSLVALIKSDLSRFSKKTNFWAFLKFYYLPKGDSFNFQVWLRIWQRIKKNKLLKYSIGLFVYPIYYIKSKRKAILINTDISIGPGLKIVHTFGVFINCKSIGENFTVYQNVTIGNDSNLKSPVIKNNVTIFVGSVITGDITLYDNSEVGCNSYVHHDVEEDCTVAGCPARVISHKKKHTCEIPIN